METGGQGDAPLQIFGDQVQAEFRSGRESVGLGKSSPWKTSRFGNPS